MHIRWRRDPGLPARNAKWSDALKIAGMSSADEAFHYPSGFAIYDLPRV
jgi:hypothetical protein